MKILNDLVIINTTFQVLKENPDVLKHTRDSEGISNFNELVSIQMRINSMLKTHADKDKARVDKFPLMIHFLNVKKDLLSKLIPIKLEEEKKDNNFTDYSCL